MKNIKYIRIAILFLMMLFMCMGKFQAAHLAKTIGIGIIALIALLIGLKKRDKLLLIIASASFILALVLTISLINQR